MVLVQNGQFFRLFILSKIGQENAFHDILGRKNAFVDYKNKGFGKKKIAISLSFSLRKIRPGKYVSRYSRKKKRVSRL